MQIVVGFPHFTTWGHVKQRCLSIKSLAIFCCTLSITAPSRSSLLLPFFFQAKGLIATCPFCKLICFLTVAFPCLPYSSGLPDNYMTSHVPTRWALWRAEHQPLDCAHHGRRYIETARRGLLCRAPPFSRNVFSGHTVTPAPGKIFQITWDIVFWLKFWGVTHHQVIASIYMFHFSGS